ncbi:MAG: DUF2726 domain-containing protein [Albidovulum sp.]|uniref:DUF2726 domain-containing protein n=1 Tax=Albidovulum sp. TaxID=1872424 RepID=UPI003CA7B9A1
MEIIFGILLAGLFVLFSRNKRQDKPPARSARPAVPAPQPAFHARRRADPTTDDRLSALRRTTITVRKPINREAYAVFVKLENAVAANAPKARVLAEVSMGAFLSTSGYGANKYRDKLAFSSFNAKRVDFLVINGFGKPVLIVEYQGSGHDPDGTAAERDMLKREAIGLAGIELVEIFRHQSPDEIDILLGAAVRRNCMYQATAATPGAVSVLPDPVG